MPAPTSSDTQDVERFRTLLREIDRVIDEMPHVLDVSGDSTRISNYALIRLRDAKHAIDRALGVDKGPGSGHGRVPHHASRAIPETHASPEKRT